MAGTATGVNVDTHTVFCLRRFWKFLELACLALICVAFGKLVNNGSLGKYAFFPWICSCNLSVIQCVQVI
jgi:hypothetical protein